MPDSSTPEPSPGETPKPPAILPPPDIKDPKKSGPTYGVTTSSSKRKRKKNERTHPTDPYPPLSRGKGRPGCHGCLGIVALLLVLAILGVVAGYFWIGPGRFVSRGYTVVNLGTSDSTVETAPDKPTVFLASGTLLYRVPVTKVPVALFAREIEIEGDFHDTTSVNAVKVTATSRARFAKDLEIHAAEFTDQGLTLRGNLTGRTLQRNP